MSLDGHSLSGMLNRILSPILFLTAALVPAMTSPAAAQQATGAIVGGVVDAASGAPLVGVNVLLEGTSHITASDRAGRFVLPAVPAGDYQLLAAYLGYKDGRSPVSVAAGGQLRVDVKLAPASFAENVTVSAEPIGEGADAGHGRRRDRPGRQPGDQAGGQPADAPVLGVRRLQRAAGQLEPETVHGHGGTPVRGRPRPSSITSATTR